MVSTSTPSVVCIDEFAFRKGHDYGTAVMDASTGQVLEFVEGKNEDAVMEALQLFVETITDVVSDLAPAMSKAIEKTYPNATHIMDHFYVTRLVSQRPEHLTEEERQKVREWCQEDAPLRHLYQSLQHLRDILKSETKKQANIRLKQWLDRYLFNDYAVVKNIAKTLVTRREALLPCVLFPYSNGIMEGTNNKIKRSKRRVYGYRNIQLW